MGWSLLLLRDVSAMNGPKGSRRKEREEAIMALMV